MLDNPPTCYKHNKLFDGLLTLVLTLCNTGGSGLNATMKHFLYSYVGNFFSSEKIAILAF